MKMKAGVVALAVTGAVVVGGAVAYAAPDQARRPEERAALERLRDSDDERDRILADWLEEQASPKGPPISGQLEVTRGGGGETREARPEDDPRYLPLLQKRLELSTEIAVLWAPNEERYQRAQAAEREDLLVDFATNNRSTLQRIRTQTEKLDRQIEAIEKAR